MLESIHRIAVPNPFFEGRNSVYLLKGDPITLIDTGVATDKAFAVLAAGLKEHGLVVGDVQRVLLTHKHIDHIGNAWRIQRESGAQVLIHQLEQKSLTDVDPTGDRFRDLVFSRMRTWGVPDEVLPDSSGQKMPLWKLEPCEVSPLPESLSIDFQNETSQLDVLHTPGHSMGSVCFRMEGCLFSGDHILEKISPNIGGGDLRSRGMLGRFLNSLEVVRKLGDVQIFPGHGEVFRGLSDRCDRLAKHHQIRLRQAQSAVDSGKSNVFEVAAALYGKLKDFHIVLGCAEANAHLEYLADNGDIEELDGRFFPKS